MLIICKIAKRIAGRVFETPDIMRCRFLAKEKKSAAKRSV